MSRRPILLLMLLASLALVAGGCFHHGGHLRHGKGEAACGKAHRGGPCGSCANARPCGGPCGMAMKPGKPCAGGTATATAPCGPQRAVPAPAASPQFFMCDSDTPCNTISDKPGTCACGKPMREMNMPPQMIEMMKQRMGQGMQAPAAEPTPGHLHGN